MPQKIRWSSQRGPYNIFWALNIGAKFRPISQRKHKQNQVLSQYFLQYSAEIQMPRILELNRLETSSLIRLVITEIEMTKALVFQNRKLWDNLMYYGHHVAEILVH